MERIFLGHREVRKPSKEDLKKRKEETKEEEKPEKKDLLTEWQDSIMPEEKISSRSINPETGEYE